MGRRSAPGPGSPEWNELRTRAVELRRDGRTRREIGEALGVRDGNKITELLRGEPRVLGGKWPDRVKQERARTLRRFGYTQYEICRVLEASRSSVSRWVHGIGWDFEVSDALLHDDVEWEELRSQAQALRREGWSLPSIAQHLELANRDDVERLCRGVPVAHGQRSRRPLDRMRARRMRLDGRTIPEIERELGVSRSTASLWVRDLPRPVEVLSDEELAVRSRRRRATAERRYFGPLRERRETLRQETKAAAQAEVGNLSDRELFLVGVALYWAEGAKDKWYSRRESFRLINSDPDVIKVMVAWLRLLEVPCELISYRVAIHESAGVVAAERYWSNLVGIAATDLRKTTLKKVRPRTNRLNQGPDYRGCLCIEVRQSAQLYQRIHGAWRGIAAAGYAAPVS
jgi:hypothetical protein